MSDAKSSDDISAADGLADLDKRPVAEVLTALGVSAESGLSNAEADQRLSRYGPNALAEKDVGLLAKLLGPFTGPIAYRGAPQTRVPWL